MKNTAIVIAFLATVMMASCGHESNSLPKPRGYFRIDLPEKGYTRLDSMEHYSFEYPQYATITNDSYSPDEKDWINVEFPAFKGSLHLTYKKVNGNLGDYLEDEHAMLVKHLQKSSGISDSLIVNDENHVYGMLTKLEGKGVATPLQFYLTDSVSNFVRGALYFNFLPNNDSLQPVIDYIQEDVNHLISTFEWK